MMIDRNAEWADRHDAKPDPNGKRFLVRKMPRRLAADVSGYAKVNDIAVAQGAMQLLVLGLEAETEPPFPLGPVGEGLCVEGGWSIRAMPKPLFAQVQAWAHERFLSSTEAAIRLIAHGLNEARRIEREMARAARRT